MLLFLIIFYEKELFFLFLPISKNCILSFQTLALQPRHVSNNWPVYVHISKRGILMHRVYRTLQSMNRSLSNGNELNYVNAIMQFGNRTLLYNSCSAKLIFPLTLPCRQEICIFSILAHFEQLQI